jgi:hypothetical protein
MNERGLVLSMRFSTYGSRLVSCGDDGARIWETASGSQLAHMKPSHHGYGSAGLTAGGRRLVTCQSSMLQIWDVSQTEFVLRERSVVLAAALARGIGLRSEAEKTDLLMQDAPDDLHAEVLRRMGRTNEEPEIAEAATELRRPLHVNCYLSPTEFEARFGTNEPPRSRWWLAAGVALLIVLLSTAAVLMALR